MTEYRCERCKRPSPPEDSFEFVEWEAIELDDGSIGMICAGCLTLAEENDIAADMEQLGRDADELRQREEGS